MRIAVFSTKRYDREYLLRANEARSHELVFLEARLDGETASLAAGCGAACLFVNDDGSRPVLERLAEGGTMVLALRSTGHNHVDVDAATSLGMQVHRVPAYSPHAVAEFTVGMILALDRKYHRAHSRVREGNFALDGLMGFDLKDRTVGVVGTGAIGRVVAHILGGFGCTVLAHDPAQDPQVPAEYVPLATLLERSDIVTLHCPLTPETHHMIDEAALWSMKPGVMLVNTSRGALIDTAAVIEALKEGQVGHLGIDVYEEEGDLFFEDLSDRVIQDDVFTRLLTFPNVLVTGHQAFFTHDALTQIAETTLANVDAAQAGMPSGNEVT